MCGRYCITSAPEAIRALFRYPEQPNFPARYNVAPTQPVPIVRMAEGERQFALVRWGLIPAWVKDPKDFCAADQCARRVGQRQAGVPERHEAPPLPVSGRRLLRVEAAAAAPSVPISRGPVAGGPIAFAGLWETWIGPNGEEMETAAIVTTQANADMATVHHRAPVIVPPEQFDFWLDCRNVDEKMAAALIAPAPDGSMEVYEISPAVNRVANDAPSLLEPYNADEAPPPRRRRSPLEARQPATLARLAVLTARAHQPCRPQPDSAALQRSTMRGRQSARERPDEDRCRLGAAGWRRSPSRRTHVAARGRRQRNRRIAATRSSRNPR